MSLAEAYADLDRAKELIDLARHKFRALEGLPAPTAPVEPPRPSPAPAPPPAGTAGLSDPKAFFDLIRDSKALGPSLSTDEVSGCEAICKACEGWPVSWTAYALATAVVETNSTMQPIREIGGKAYFTRRYDIRGERPDKARELGNLQPGDGAAYCGRGYVQLTGRAGYAKAGQKLGVALIENPDLALDPIIAAQIMRGGLSEGWFTGKSLSLYLPAEADLRQFSNARRTVNGLDRAAEIGAYAIEFQAALKAGGWA